jgi:predicted ester cyclase
VERNKELVRQFVDAINRQEWRRFDELVAPESFATAAPLGSRMLGRVSSFGSTSLAEFETFPDAHEHINFVFAESNMIVVHSHCRAMQQGSMGSFPASGKTLSADFISIYRLAGGRIVEAWTEWDVLNGLIQLGHMEPPKT